MHRGDNIVVQTPLQQQSIPWLAITVLVGCIILSTWYSSVDNTQGDSRGSLLLAQTILQEGTVKLDSHPDIVSELQYRVREKNGHVYYYFPIGTALYSVPFVAAANLAGQDMRIRYEENRMQRGMAVLLGVCTFLLLFLIARPLTQDSYRSVLLATLFWFGTGYSSTSATALFSHHWATVFTLLSIFLVTRPGSAAGNTRLILTGVFLFSAYLCRPTLALLSPTLILFLFFVDRIAAVKVAGTVFTMLIVFSIWSLAEFGQPLPDYYLPKRLDATEPFRALVGHLFSPSRGLFVFMPFLVVPFIFWRRSLDILSTDKRILLILAWLIAHLFSVSSFPHWWGGYSYGPRLMLDIVPAFYMFFCLYFKDLSVGSWAVRATIVAGLLAIYINWYQGLFNVYTYQWNVQPSVERAPQTIWDWHYPQFLHSQARHNQREREFLPLDLEPIRAGETVDFQSDRLAFVGWHEPWPLHRWSRGPASEIYFGVTEEDSYKGELRLTGQFQGRQVVRVSINDLEVDRFEAAGTASTSYEVHFDPGLLSNSRLNLVTLEFSDASQPSRGQHFHMAMALEALTLE